jgi:hypothetical protein
MGEAFGPEVAGLMSTFPAVTLTVLCLTYLESGPASTLRMARALPAGNLAMVGFLATFRFACPIFGLAWGTLLGYVASLVILAGVVGSGRLKGWASERLLALRGEARPNWPRAGRRFSPWLEPFGS